MIVQHHLVFGRKYIKPAPTPTLLFDIGINTITNGNLTRTNDHKGTNTAIQFGNGNLVSALNLPVSSVWSISFWLKTTQTALSVCFELSNPWDYKNSFIGLLNYQISNSLTAGINTGTGTANTTSNVKGATGFNNGIWNHVVIILDRSKPATNEVTIYKNNTLLSLTNIQNGDDTGSFISDKIYIGGRGNSFTLPLNAAMSPVKMYDFTLTQSQVESLFYE